MGNEQVAFVIDGVYFEYDKWKNEINIKKHGISFEIAARVFFDQNRIEMFDEENSIYEERYDTIGSTIAGLSGSVIGRIGKTEDIIFVVYTERFKKIEENAEVEVIRLISARMATNFERGLYYGKYN